MTSMRNHQTTTVLFVIALTGLLLVSTSSVANAQRGGGHAGGGHGGGHGGSNTNTNSGGSNTNSGGSNTNSLLVDGNNTGVNLQTDANQKQDCQSAGENSPLLGSCFTNSNNQNTESGGILKK